MTSIGSSSSGELNWGLLGEGCFQKKPSGWPPCLSESLTFQLHCCRRDDTPYQNTSIHSLKPLQVLNKLINNRFQVLSKACNERQLPVCHACLVTYNKRQGLLFAYIYSENSPGCGLQLMAKIRFHCCNKTLFRFSVWAGKKASQPPLKEEPFVISLHSLIAVDIWHSCVLYQTHIIM